MQVNNDSIRVRSSSSTSSAQLPEATLYENPGQADGTSAHRGSATAKTASKKIGAKITGSKRKQSGKSGGNVAGTDFKRKRVAEF